MIKYPKPLQKGSTIAITAPSSGVAPQMHQRLNLVLQHLHQQGFRVVEGECLRANERHVSAPKKQRAAELMHFLLDPKVDAIMPPWGGEIGMDLLDCLDYSLLAEVPPKWIVGHSDISTLLNALTSKLGWCTVHATNLMQMVPAETEPLTASALAPLSLATGQSFTQHAASHFQSQGLSFSDYPEQGLQLGPDSQWKILGRAEQVQCRGRLFGGCLDILIHLAATEYFDINRFEHWSQGQGIILYLENAELSPTALFRALQGLKYRGIFKGVNTLLMGRNAGQRQADFSDKTILAQLFSDAPFPVIYDADIGHLPPNMTLLNGALADIRIDRGQVSITQQLLP